jgi:hypothetical protein
MDIAKIPPAYVARIPHERALALLCNSAISSAGFTILIELVRLVSKGRGQNPVRLTNARLRELGISRQTKCRQLHLLETQGIVSVRWSDKDRIGLLVTYLWRPIQE